MELLVGCGTNLAKQVTFDEIPKEWCELVTLDSDASLSPHVVHDLNNIPYPFTDDTFDEIHAYEVLEHCGKQGDWRFFLDQFTEFHRILKPGGWFVATVPAWDSIWAWSDPGHTRVISEGSLLFLSQESYEQVGKTSMTDYRSWYKANFQLVSANDQKGSLVFVLKAIK